MNILLDIAGAFLIRGAIIVITLSLSVGMSDALYYKKANENIQADLTSTVDIFESDFRKIGFSVTSDSSLLKIDSSFISFLGDIDDNGVVDTVNYYLGDTTSLAGTPNPRDRFLYRRVNSVGNGNYFISGSGVTLFHIKYYNSSGVETTVPSLVASLLLSLQIEHAYVTYNKVYPQVQWQRRIFISNI